MSKKNSLLKMIKCVVALSCLYVLVSGDGRVGTAQKAQPAAINPKAVAIREATDEILRETSEIRKLSILRPVASGAQSRAEIEQTLIHNLDQSSTPLQLAASEMFLKKMGQVPADFQLRPFIIKLLTEQVAGYYDPKTQRFYLADWIDPDGQKPVIAHELTHALQDQHFNLRRFEKWPKHDADAELAAHALIEGDATALMLQYATRNPLRVLAMLKSMAESGSVSTEQIDKAPRALRETLLFPYTQGMTWVNQLYQRGGWELVSQAYTDLPKSTEQILHADKYFAHEAPIANIAQGNLLSVLGKGWKQLDNDVNGEWGYYLILDEFLKSADEAQQAAAGWNGDRYMLYAGTRAGEVLITQKTFWDTENDAREFFDAYSKRTSRRYEVEPATVEATDVARRWKTKEGSVLIERKGKSVLIVEGVPDNFSADALIKLL